MKEFVEKMIERLEEKAIKTLGINRSQFAMDKGEYSSYCSLSLDDVKEITKDLASENNNGWIPCEVRLPENNRDVYVTYINKITGDSISSVGWYYQKEKAWFVGHNDKRQKVTAWCPKLPPYKKGE